MALTRQSYDTTELWHDRKRAATFVTTRSLVLCRRLVQREPGDRAISL